MKTHWELALVKGIREPHEVKKKSFDLGGNRTYDLQIRSTVILPTEVQGGTEKVCTLTFSLPRFTTSIIPYFLWRHLAS